MTDDLFDFSKLGRVARAPKAQHPIEIFERLPNLPGTPNDLWRGQTEALNGWHAARTKNDVLIGLNTGAGKTLAGLLIGQSLVNEGVENVVYVCATIDLVNQTAREARRIGLGSTTRVGSRGTHISCASVTRVMLDSFERSVSYLSRISRHLAADSNFGTPFQGSVH